jgi:hypothetical protein
MPFTKLERDEEIRMLQGDSPSFSETRRYILPLIDSSLDRFDLSGKKRDAIRQRLIEAIPVAAGRYLRALPGSREGSFAVYYAWYIHQEMERHGVTQSA